MKTRVDLELKKNSKIEVQLKDTKEKLKILEQKNEKLLANKTQFDKNKVINF